MNDENGTGPMRELRLTLEALGSPVPPSASEDGSVPRIQLRPEEAWRMGTCLFNGSLPPGKGPVDAWPDHADVQGPAHIFRELAALFGACGVDAGAVTSGCLEPISEGDADRLNEALLRGMGEVGRAKREVLAAFKQHNLPLDPGPVVLGAGARVGPGAAMDLGLVDVATADRLALLLGAPPQPGLVPEPDGPQGEALAERLHSALRNVASKVNGLINVRFNGYCQSCHSGPGVWVDCMFPEPVFALAAALLARAPEPTSR